MRSYIAAVAVVLMTCSQPPPVDPPVTTPPQAFLVVEESDIIGTSIKGTTSTSGCKNVTQVRLLANGNFLADAKWVKNPTPFEIPAGALTNSYANGIAASITLTAEVACDDGRTNKSQPVGVRFFPVASVVTVEGGQALPDTFIAEGGVNGTPTTFIGCVGGQTGTQLARVDIGGGLTMSNGSLPFACTVDSEITDRALSTGTRWLLQKGVGVFAFDRMLNITSAYMNNVQEIGVAADGDAIVFSNTAARPLIARLHPGVAAGANPVVWSTELNLGQVNVKPVIDAATNSAYVGQFEFSQGTRAGDIIVYRFNYATGIELTNMGIKVWSQTFPELAEPIMPRGSFNRDGSLIYVPLVAQSTQGQLSTVVYACATNVSGCQNAARRWTSPVMGGVMQYSLVWNSGTALAVAGGTQTQFLNTSTGAIISNSMLSTRPEGSLIVNGLQPGLGTDFYVLHAPNRQGAASYPTEIVGLDRPESGELWRLSYGGGEVPTGGMWIAVDEAGTVWLRVGANQVKPLKNSEYRAVRGSSSP